jgi:hypothetical protein
MDHPRESSEQTAAIVMAAVRVMGEDRLDAVRVRYQEENAELRGCLGRLRRHIRQALDRGIHTPDSESELREALAIPLPGPRR